MKMPREFYLPNHVDLIVRDKQSSAIAYLYTSKTGKPVAAMFGGKRAKPDRHFRYVNDESRMRAVQEHFECIRYRESRKRAAASPRTLQVGDVLRSMWGYEQTNIDYYEVTALIGKQSVEIRQIGCESVDTHYMQGKSVPVPGAYIGKQMRKRANGDSVKIESYAYAYKLEPTEIAGTKIYSATHWTAYA